MSDRRCVIGGCRELGEHLDDCSSDRCKGCRPRAVQKGQVCPSDRTGIASTLFDIRDLDAQLREDPDPVDHSTRDGLALILPMGIVPSGLGAGARVSGSREPAAPTDLDRLDLAGPARPAELSPAGWRHMEDQIGHQAVAAELFQLVRIWREDLFADESLPRPTVAEMVKWLGDRLDTACNEHLAIDEFAMVIRVLRSALRRKLGLNAPPKTLCKGVACKACDLLTLYREGGLISCGNCGLNYSDDEYRKWVGMLNAETIQRLRSGELEMPDSVEVRRLVA